MCLPIRGFQQWTKISSRGDSFRRPKISPPFGSSTTPGRVYRKQYPPHSMPQLFNPDFTPSRLQSDGFIKMPVTPLQSRYICPKSPRSKIATLAHGLERALESPGIHHIQDPTTKEYIFPPYLRRLHHPSEIDYDRMQPFITTSKDMQLHDIALEVNIKWKGSTSSISSVLSHIYHLLSNYRPVNVHNLSGYFQAQTTRFPPSTRAPVALLLLPSDGIYSIDKYQPQSTNTILSCLGKSYERMVTMEQEKFENSFLKSSPVPCPPPHHPEAFNYLHVGNFLLRSQLDCYASPVGVFDLKSRATNPIRIFSGDDPSLHLAYRITSLTGPTHSFEREYYDMIRSSFLRNIFQVRIGNMSGIFVAYHNTQEIFGFEFLPLAEMEQCIFQSKTMADYSFDMTLKVLDLIINKVIAHSGFGIPLRVYLQAKHMSEQDFIYIFVEKICPEEQKARLDPGMPMTIGEKTRQSLKIFKLNIETCIDNKITRGPLNLCDDNEVQTWVKMEELKLPWSDMALKYFQMLQEFCPTKERRMSRFHRRPCN